MAAPVQLINARRERPNRFRADITIHGTVVGHVERGWSMGGRGADRYTAWAEGLTVADGRTLRDLMWVQEEQQMEQDAIWLRVQEEER